MPPDDAPLAKLEACLKKARNQEEIEQSWREELWIQIRARWGWDHLSRRAI